MSTSATKGAKIRVLLAEDQTMIRGALAALLELESDIQVIAQAANGREAERLTREMKPDVVVTDIEMPEWTGLEFAAALKENGSKVSIIILTTFARPGYLRRALDAGARGYLLKDRPAAELAQAIRRVHTGLRAIDPELAAEAWNADADPLNDRERQILQRLLRLAENLFLPPHQTPAKIFALTLIHERLVFGRFVVRRYHDAHDFVFLP